MIWKSSRALSTLGSPTLVDLLHDRAAEKPLQAAYTFLGEGLTEAEASSETWSRIDLLQRAQTIGAWLQQTTSPGDRALMLYPSGLDFIAAFFGCLEAGVVAVPAYPPDPMRLERSVPRLAAIAADADTRVVLTTQQLLGQTRDLTSRFPQLARASWLATDQLVPGEGDLLPVDIKPSSLAFFQYTSGSTGTPKGVMVTHSNLVQNLRCFRDVLDLEGSDFVSWLPLFHDMGLIQGVLLSLYVGSRCTLMAPGTFIRSPLRWLQAISRTERTMSAAPNFAYKLCLRKVSARDREALDLSRWDIALNGAEPVRAETMERFSSFFAPAGFRRNAFWPGYGLAEATLMVTGGSRLSGPTIVHVKPSSLERGVVEVAEDSHGSDLVPYVACGYVIPGHELAIADPATGGPLPEARIGEIWMRGPSSALGYWNREKETRETFHATLEGDPVSDWLRTGDLGFVLDEQLYISSRLKDLIIVRGRNHFPQDIELTVEQSHPALRPGGVAAFSVDVGEEERLVVVQEADPTQLSSTDPVFSAVLEAVGATHELYPQAIALIRPGSIPKTSSGKIQRRATKAAYLQGELDTLAVWTRDRRELASEAPPSRVMPRGVDRLRILASPPQRHRVVLSMFLMGQIAAVLRLPSPWVEVDKPLGSFGIDSLMALELKNRLEVSLDLLLPMVDLLRSPTIAELAEVILAQLESGEIASKKKIFATESTITDFPLSYGQSALWFLQRISPGSAAYNLLLPVRIVSEVDVPTLRRAFGAVVDRHPALKVVFSEQEGELVQKIDQSHNLPWEVVDGSLWPWAEVEAFLHQRAKEPFDLAVGPLFRVSLVLRAPGEHVLMTVLHHSIVDFWSIGIFVREIGLQYTAFMRNTEPLLEPTRLQYSDYVMWQRAMLEGAEGHRLRTYWRNELGGVLPVLDLPTDFPRPAIQSFDGASVSFRVPPPLVKSLRALGGSERVTLYTLLLAAFQVLLARYSGQDDILVGSPSAGRNRADLMSVIGYFVNTLVLRGNFADNPTFTEYLVQARQKVLGALEHDELPFALLVKDLLTGRDPSRSPIFQAMFAVEKEPSSDDETLTPFALRESGARMTLGALSFESLPLEHRVAQFDLSMMMAEVGDDLVGSLEYNTSLFGRATVAGMVQHFLVLLQSIVDAPNSRVRDLPLMSTEEVRSTLIGWSGTSSPCSDLLAHQLFEARVDAAPDADAVVAGAQCLTYRQLDAAANRLANFLIAQGVRGEDRVAVCLSKGVELAVSLMAILKAGAGYIPLDAEFPRERLAYMAADAQIRALITTRSLQNALQLSAPTTVCVDDDAELVEKCSSDRPSIDATPSSLAYVLYTSGSTGRPKGVMIEHRSLVNFLESMRDNPGIESGETLLSLTTPSFDIFGLEFFLPLSVGAKVVFATKALVRDGNLLSDYLARSDVAVLQGTPSALQLLVDAGGPLRGRLKVLCGGEPLSESLARRLLERVGSLFNMYGPTETTIWSSLSRIEAERPISIGRPIRNTRFFVLDAHGQLAPPGARGELCIGGVGVARGYLNRPELTAERFPTLKLPILGSIRVYRTGDLVRRTTDGELTFLGRTDQQLKLRGFRVEPGEIENVVLEHPDVREAAVVVAPDESGGHLVAYVTPRPGAQLKGGELRHFARERLPEYMLPSVWIVLEDFPRTLNKKVDRRALLEIDNPDTVAESYPPPANALEAMILEQWRSALGNPRLTSRENFFDAGGHSMLAAVVMTRLGKELGLRLPLHTIFTAPTASGMAGVVESLRRDDAPGSGFPSAELEALVHLDAELSPSSREVNPSHPMHVLLTGATGFLGAYLLDALLQRTSATIHCLVRGNAFLARGRLVENLRTYGLWRSDWESRIVVVEGDLDRPLVGLAPDAFSKLADRIDAIYHNGALVDFVRPFRLLKATNVLGTVELLRLAAQGRGKAFHFVSTLSVFPSLRRGQSEYVASESDPLRLAAGDRIHGDYAESKWVADRTVTLAQQRGFAASIFRPGIVYGHSESGVGRTDDFIHTFVKGCVELGKWPALETWVNLTPVDHVVRALVELSLTSFCLGRAFHLTNPVALPVEGLADLIREYGYELETVPYRSWRAEVARTVDAARPNSLVALLPYLTEESGDLFRQPFFDARNVLDGLAGTGISFPPADRALVHRWLGRLVGVGFLPQPGFTR
jgi:amino acid adenylation domain-containing protein/thioester reductase-like protein